MQHLSDDCERFADAQPDFEESSEDSVYGIVLKENNSALRPERHSVPFDKRVAEPEALVRQLTHSIRNLGAFDVAVSVEDFRQDGVADRQFDELLQSL